MRLNRQEICESNHIYYTYSDYILRICVNSIKSGIEKKFQRGERVKWESHVL